MIRVCSCAFVRSLPTCLPPCLGWVRTHLGVCVCVCDGQAVTLDLDRHDYDDHRWVVCMLGCLVSCLSGGRVWGWLIHGFSFLVLLPMYCTITHIMLFKYGGASLGDVSRQARKTAPSHLHSSWLVVAGGAIFGLPRGGVVMTPNAAANHTPSLSSDAPDNKMRAPYLGVHVCRPFCLFGQSGMPCMRTRHNSTLTSPVTLQWPLYYWLWCI